MLASISVASAEIYMIQFGGFDNSYWISEDSSPGQMATALCNVGDKIIAGSTERVAGRAGIFASHPVFDVGPNLDQEGWFGSTAEALGGSGLRVWAHCLKPLSMAVGGFEIQPDTVAILLAYGIMNSYWMLPTAVGIGVGIYLVKRRF